MPSAKRRKDNRSLIARICTDHRFLSIVCIISVCDALIVVTELTLDILATKAEKAEICDTEDILEHLQYKGFLTNHTVDELIRSIQERKASQHILLHPNISILNSSKRPQTTVPTTPELTTPKRPLTGSEPSSQSFVESHLLYEIAHYCRYASIALLSAMLLINIIRVAALRMKFLHSKLQVIDAVVVVISLAIDIAFLPSLWKYTDPLGQSLPIIVGLSWRVIRVVNNSLINLSEKDKILLARVNTMLKRSMKKSRQRKSEIMSLRGLCSKLGAGESEILACKTTLKKVRKRSILEGILSVNALAFFGLNSEKLPHASSHSNAHDEESEDDLANDNTADGAVDGAADDNDNYEKIRSYKGRYRKSIDRGYGTNRRFSVVSSVSKVSDTSANLYVKYGGGDDEEEDDGDMADIDDAISDYESDAGDSDEQQSDSGGYDNPVILTRL